MRAAIATALIVVAVGAAGWRLIDSPALVAQADGPAQPADLVSSVSFTGTDMSPHATRVLLRTRRGVQLRPDELEADRSTLEASLREQGFWQAIVAAADVRVGPSGAHVVFAIERGAPFRTGAVTVRGVDATLATELQRGLTVAAGDTITPSAIARNQALIGDMLALRRLADRTVRSITTVDATAHRVEVEFVITPAIAAAGAVHTKR